MKITKLATLLAAVLLAANAAFGQTITVTGNVTGLSDTYITMTSGTDTWNIKKGTTTVVTTGTLAVGNTVTVQCLSGDAQKVPSNAQKKE